MSSFFFNVTWFMFKSLGFLRYLLHSLNGKTMSNVKFFCIVAFFITYESILVLLWMAISISHYSDWRVGAAGIARRWPFNSEWHHCDKGRQVPTPYRSANSRQNLDKVKGKRKWLAGMYCLARGKVILKWQNFPKISIEPASHKSVIFMKTVC